MVDRIEIQKAVNGYVVTSSWYKQSDHTICFKDMAELVKHLDDCFAKPFKDLTYVTKLKKDANNDGNATGDDKATG